MRDLKLWLLGLQFSSLVSACVHDLGLTATCVFDPFNGVGELTGTLSFVQSSSSSPLFITGTVSGVRPNSALHGFHVHAEGGLGDNCKEAKGHFNPFQNTHGGPWDNVRHVGDLGNVVADDNGVVAVDVVDHQASLFGDLSINGRSIVLHEGIDDLGRGGDEGSLKTGNAGARLGCCRIQPQL